MSHDEVLIYFFAGLMTLVALYIWVRVVVNYYFTVRRKHNLKMVRELKEEDHTWPD